MKSSLILLICLFGLIFYVNAANARIHPIGETIMETLHIDFKNLATAPSTTILWQPRWPGLWRIQWWQFVFGEPLISTMTAGNYTPDSGRDLASTGGQDGGIIILGDGTNLDCFMTGPYFGDSEQSLNLTAGENYTIINENYLILSKTLPAFTMVDILSLTQQNNLDLSLWDWGYHYGSGFPYPTIWGTDGSWTTPPSMSPIGLIPSVGYRRNVTPLRAQWAFTTNSLLPNEPNDGHLYLSFFVTKVAN